MINGKETDYKVSLQPAFVLHTYPWKETSLIVEAFTRDYGRLALVARGAKRPMSQYRGMLNPFCPLAVSFSGKGETKNLTKCEWHGTILLPDTAIMSAFYMNELLVRLITKRDPVPGLFSSYFSTLRKLSEGFEQHLALRYFELDLLDTIGYGLPDPREGTNYLFKNGDWLDIGPNPVSQSVSFETLKAMKQRCVQRGPQEKLVRGIIRDLITYYLDDRPVNTRNILSELRKI